MDLNNQSHILTYYEEIKSGNIIVGRELILQLEMLVKELTDTEYQEANRIKIDYEASEKTQAE